ncbi:hypothetical protein BROUX41_000601 [Berkeleyomyces rouxiae]|uniref:uncharacterized protein n=1 Tax=Berkeleyomyces rouxiae TaxID=2035830 RepID=UPI003B7D6D3E
MKSTTFFLAAVAGLVSAQTSLPSCATECVSGFTSGSNIAGCSQGDVACICGNNDFLSQIACCLVDACGEEDQAATLSYASSLCQGFGVDVPNEIACNSNSTGTASPSGTTTANGTTTATSTSTSTSTSSQIAGAAALSGSAGFAGVAGILAALALF